MYEEEKLIQIYRGKGVLVDTNLLLLLLVGNYDPSLIRRFKRTGRYTEDDYLFLAQLIRMFSKIITTPHVLTEVSNLANGLGEPIKQFWFQNFYDALQLFEEHPLPARATDQTEFAAFGLTDAALVCLGANTLLVTEDYRLSGYLRSKNLPVINFSTIRSVQDRLHAR